MTKKIKFTLWFCLCFITLILVIPLPSPLFNTPNSTILRASNNDLLGVTIADDEQWRFPPSKEIPEKFITAILLFEDEYFYSHFGVNPVSLFRAMKQNFRAGKIISGGSTLTMQTVRMMYGNQKRTYFQKLKELVASLKLELFYSKNEILNLYTSHAPFGGNIVGLNAASWRYYGRSPELLSWAEIASLAVLPNNPSGIYPGKNAIAFLHKRNKLLEKLYTKKIISKDDLFLAKSERLPGKIIPFENNAPHLLNRLKKDGLSGVNTRSTIDYTLQKQVVQKVNSYSLSLKANQINNAAALVIDIETGNTLAYVGNSRSTGNHGQDVDIITSLRSPGSLLKPMLYALAIEDGIILPHQLLEDIPVFFKGFSPKNFDKKYRGVVPANEALASSLNVPFVRLLSTYGVEKFHYKLKQMGYSNLKKSASHYGLSLILGGAESSIWEMSSLYASMARNYFNTDGLAYKPNNYLYIKNEIKPETIKNSIDQTSLGYTFRAMQNLRRPLGESGWKMFGSARPIAWKTGTSVGFRDAWAIGVNNKYVVAIWAGNADGEGRPGLTGITTASPLMFDIFSLLEGDAKFTDEFAREAIICSVSGLRASEYCSETKKQFLPEKSFNGNKCTYHKQIYVSSDSVFQVNSSCYPISKMKKMTVFKLSPVEAWYYKQNNSNYHEPPPFLDGCNTLQNQDMMEMIYPRQFTSLFIPKEQNGERGNVIFEATHRLKSAKIFWHLDNLFIGTTRNPHQKEINAAKGKHTLTLVDENGDELIQKFNIMN